MLGYIAVAIAALAIGIAISGAVVHAFHSLKSSTEEGIGSLRSDIHTVVTNLYRDFNDLEQRVGIIHAPAEAPQTAAEANEPIPAVEQQAEAESAPVAIVAAPEPAPAPAPAVVACPTCGQPILQTAA